MLQIITISFFSGLSSGIYCFAYCLSFIAPFMVAEARDKKSDFLNILKFISGRLSGYLFFGAVFGYFGEKFNNETLNFFIIIAILTLSLILILQSIGFLANQRFSFCKKIKNLNPKFPFVAGFLLGVNICPPFLVSLAYIFNLHSFLKGIIYFFSFFIGTSLYFLPLFLLGFLNKIKEFQLAGKISGFVVGVFFFVYSLYTIFLGTSISHSFRW